MKKKLGIAVGLIIIILVVNAVFVTRSQNEHMKEIYAMALESYMTVGEDLNDSMAYIAIDTGTLKALNDKEKAWVLDYFKERYNLEIMDASFNDLKAMGKVKEGNFIDGVLLSVDRVTTIPGFAVRVEGSKFRSGLGAVGVKTTIGYTYPKWKVKDYRMIWIS